MASGSDLPRVLEVSRLVATREPEVAALLASLQPRRAAGVGGGGVTLRASSGLPWGGAALPRSARRRATSHNPAKKKTKRRRTDFVEIGEKKKNKKMKMKEKTKAKRRKTAAADGDEAAAPSRSPCSSGSVEKKLSRRARRKPRRLQEQIALSALSASSAPLNLSSLPAPPLRLETHLWHAKRMTMGSPWAVGGEHTAGSSCVVALGAPGAGRGDRAIASAVRGRALAHDASYWLALRLRGGEAEIVKVLDAAAPGWRGNEGAGTGGSSGSGGSSRRRRKRQGRRRGFSTAVLAGRAETDAVLETARCPVRLMFNDDAGSGGESADGDAEKGEESRRKRVCLVWVHSAAEVEARAALSACISALSSSSSSSSSDSIPVSLDPLPAPLRRLEVVGALADAVVVGAIGAAVTAAEQSSSGSGRDGRAWAALRAGNPSAFSAMPSGCALRIVASDPRLSKAPREVRAVVGGGARRVAAVAKAAIGRKKEKEEKPEEKSLSERPRAKKRASPSSSSLASARVAACLLSARRSGQKKESKGGGCQDRLVSSSSLLPYPLPTRAVSAVRGAARRAGLGLLPLPRGTAREVERCFSASSSFSTTFPLAAVRRFPSRPPRPRSGRSDPSPSPSSPSSPSPLRLPHWSLVLPAGWALPVWRALVASKSGGVGGGGGAAGKKQGNAKILRGKGVAVAGQREWRWCSSICPSDPSLAPFYPHDWPEGSVARSVREMEEASAEREDAKRPPGKKKKLAKSKGETTHPLLPDSFTVARTWPQVREALVQKAAIGEGGPPRDDYFVPAALWPERRGTLSAGSRVFLLSCSSPPTISSPSLSSRGDFLGSITSSLPRGCPPGVAPAAGLLRARTLWGARFAGKTKDKDGPKEEEKEENKKEKKKKKRPSEEFVRVVVVLPDGREVVARAAPSGVAASLW